MKISWIKKSVVFIITLFILLGSFGMSHTGMKMGADGSMSDCPFTPGVTICSMSLFDMISASQSFVSDITLLQDVTLLTLLISGLFVLGTLLRFFSPPRTFDRYRFRKRSEPFLHNYLSEAFSSGLLNPKLF